MYKQNHSLNFGTWHLWLQFPIHSMHSLNDIGGALKTAAKVTMEAQSNNEHLI